MPAIKCGQLEIVGAKYRNLSQRQINELVNETVDLKREPSNEHDPNAIACFAYLQEGMLHIGYIPAKLAIHLAPMMDEGGMHLQALIKQTDAVRMRILAELIWVKE